MGSDGLGRRLSFCGVYFGKLIEPLVGLAEAAEIMQWSKSQVNTYMARGKFPDPIQRLTATPVWTRKQIEQFKKSREDK